MLPSLLNPSPSAPTNPRAARLFIRSLIYAGSVIALLILFFVVKFFLWARCFDLHAFRVPSGSMCPAICENERIIAGMDAFRDRAPQRGDIILFDRDEGTTKFIKRIIGVAGDTVSFGPSNTILVNNKPLALPPPCGDHNAYARLAPQGSAFQPVKVPEGSLFVVGDNLDNSYDSRHFGLVTVDKIRGKALLVYYSPDESRIGCRIN
jgi:signal peptidase I